MSPSVLLVEDDKVTRKVTTLFIEKGFVGKAEISQAENLSLALELLKLNTYDAIILDLNLPDSQGLNTLEQVVRPASGAAIVVLTGSSQERIGLQSVRMGAQDFLEKGSFNASDLEKSLRFSMQRSELLRMLNQLAVQDALCGGYNRRGFFQSSKQLLSEVEESSECFLVCFDLNGFKQINDSYGHAAGDEFLVCFAELMRRSANNSMITGRLGGDEFIVLGSKGGASAADGFLQTLGRLTEAAIPSEGIPEKIRFCAGYLVFTPKVYQSNSLDKLIELADQHLYSEKHYIKHQITPVNYSWRGGSFDDLTRTVTHTDKAFTSGAGLDWPAGRALLQMCRWNDEPLWKHQIAVGLIAERIAQAMDFNYEECVKIRWGGELHDIGKLALPEGLLDSPRKLSPEEFQQVRKHPELGAELLRGLDPPHNKCTVQSALYHHERWDGTGYPAGVKGAEIPRAARIVSVADVFHVLITDRPYRAGVSVEEALKELKSVSGTQLDPDVVSCFLALESEGAFKDIPGF